MKPLSTIRVALTFTGCFLGAGYVSGQELWQFFGVYGADGVWGLALAMVLLALFGMLLLNIARKSGQTRMDTLIVFWDAPALRRIVAGIAVFFLFCVYLVMAAGAGALVQRLFSVPAAVGSLLFCALVMLVTIRGLGGVVSVFSALVPVLAVAAVAIGIGCVAKFGLPAAAPRTQPANPLLGGWAFAAVTFVSYNLISSMGILSLLGPYVSGRRAVAGTALGAALLAVIGGGILAAVAGLPQAQGAQLPMLEAANALHPAVGWGYAALLFGGMFGAALSCCVAVTAFMSHQNPDSRRRKAAWSGGVSVLAWIGSLAGFGTLVGTVFPISGYIGFLLLGCMLAHWLRLRKAA